MSETYYLPPQRRNLSKGSKVWYGGISLSGNIKWISLRTENKKVADEWFNKMQASRFAPQKESAAKVGVKEAIKAFMLDVENVRKRAAGTVITYNGCFDQFGRFCESMGISEMDKITPALCSEFARLEFASLAANTVKNRVITLRSFFSWATDQYSLPMKNPFKKIVTAKAAPVPREFWTIEECEKIIAATENPEIKCFFAIMAFAGLRRDEAGRLAMDNLSGGKISLIGKGGKAATLPISSRLKAYLNAYLVIRGNEPGALFPNLSKRVVVPEGKIKKIAAEAIPEGRGIAHCHRFRHSFASNLIRIGRSIKAVQMLMRHKNVTLTLNTYGHLLPSDLEEAVEL